MNIKGPITKILGKKKSYKLVKVINRHLRKIIARCYGWQMELEWNKKDMPEWFDHNIDLYYYWRKKRNPQWLERGCYNLLAIKQGGNLLELCCSDGFNAYYFYSIRAKRIIAVDFDENAINQAKSDNQADNITYQLCDIRTGIPEGVFDNIIWDAAIEHFTKEEIQIIMSGIKKRLSKDGILSGHTIVEANIGEASHHEIEFKSKEDLMHFFSPYFKNIKIFETIYPSRHNLYFYASDGILPFDENWRFQITS